MSAGDKFLTVLVGNYRPGRHGRGAGATGRHGGGTQRRGSADRARLRARVLHRYRVRHGRSGPRRGRDPADLEEEAGTGFHARVAPAGVPALADDERAHLGQRHASPHRLPVDSLTTPRRSRGPMLPRASTRSTPSSSRPTRSSAFPSTSAPRSPGWRWMRCSTASRSPPRSRTGSRKKASCSVPSPRRSGTIRRWWSAISEAWCPTPTTFSRASTPRCSPTAPSSTSPRGFAARWSSPPTSASTPRTPDSSNAP